MKKEQLHRISITELYAYIYTLLRMASNPILRKTQKQHYLAEMGEASEYKVVEEFQAGPKTMRFLPLTFLDTHLAGPIYVKRQFFYKFPHSQHYFQQTTLPFLKHTLSIALQIFYPLSGSLICPPKPQKPYIQCTKQDTVSFKLVVSSSDFNRLSSNESKKKDDFDPLIPKLRYRVTKDEDEEYTIVFPLLALQATVWENHGVCIAITYCHVMDDRCCDHFMKTWSSLCRTIIFGGDSVYSRPQLLPLPCYDRELLKDPDELQDAFLKDYFKDRLDWKDKFIANQTQTKNLAPQEETEHFKATFVFGSEDVKRMKIFALNQLNKMGLDQLQYLSTFVVICAFVWSSLVKSRNRDNDNEQEVEKQSDEHFRFAADCTERLGYPIPKTYFGNCIVICSATLKRMELKKNGEGGFVSAVRVIERAINDMKKKPFRDAKNWNESFKKFPTRLVVTGSPKFLVYDTDFGFGKPVKVEMDHSSKAMSLAESRDGKGGVEVGLVFSSLSEYECFKRIIEKGLQTFRGSNLYKCY